MIISGRVLVCIHDDLGIPDGALIMDENSFIKKGKTLFSIKVGLKKAVFGSPDQLVLAGFS